MCTQFRVSIGCVDRVSSSVSIGCPLGGCSKDVKVARVKY